MLHAVGRARESGLPVSVGDGAAESPSSNYASSSGVDAFIRSVSLLAWLAYLGHWDTSQFVQEIGELYAHIRLEDIGHPRQFLTQMAGAPPVQFGTSGFRPSLIDDANPARHYTAFLFVGFYLPIWISTLMLILWEVAGFIRYRGEWSWPDIRSGWLGIRHGRLVREQGSVVLPGLIAAQLAVR